MEKENLEKLKKSLEKGGIIKCYPILKTEATKDSEAFELVDVKNRDYICRLYNMNEAEELFNEVSDLPGLENLRNYIMCKFIDRDFYMETMQYHTEHKIITKLGENARFIHNNFLGEGRVRFACISINCIPKYINKNELRLV